MRIRCMSQETQTGLCINLEGMGREMGGSFKREGIYVYLWLIHGEGNGTRLQYFCLENPMDGGAW